MKQCINCGEQLEQELLICPVCNSEAFENIKEKSLAITNQTHRVVIVGNGAAAFHAAKAIRERSAMASVVIYGDEPYYAYNRPMLTKALLLCKSCDKMYIKQAQWYQDNNIEIHLGVAVEHVSPEEKTILLADGEVVAYDKLILATGATSFLPPMPGIELEQVYAIRNYRDTKKIEDNVASCQHVVVIGGGVLGLEAAWQFKKQGIHVTILELAPKLMVRQLDDEASDLLFDLIQAQGMDVMVGVTIAALVGDQKVSGVRLADGTVIPADMVIVSTGIRANVALGKLAGVHINRAIVVDEKCATSIPDIYACGDCAEYDGINYGIWPEATEMGKVAGANAVGDALTYQGVSAAITFHGMNTQLYAIGDVGKDPNKNYDTVVLRDAVKQTYASYYFVNDLFVGAVLFQDTSDMKRVNLAYHKQSSKKELFPE